MWEVLEVLCHPLILVACERDSHEMGEFSINEMNQVASYNLFQKSPSIVNRWSIIYSLSLLGKLLQMMGKSFSVDQNPTNDGWIILTWSKPLHMMINKNIFNTHNSWTALMNVTFIPCPLLHQHTLSHLQPLAARMPLRAHGRPRQARLKGQRHSRNRPPRKRPGRFKATTL